MTVGIAQAFYKSSLLKQKITKNQVEVFIKDVVKGNKEYNKDPKKYEKLFTVNKTEERIM